MKNKQLSKRREVAKKRHQRQTGTAEGEKTVTVSGALGPFSLLLQVCYMNKTKPKKNKLRLNNIKEGGHTDELDATCER